MDVPENSTPYWLVQFCWETFRLSLGAPQLETGMGIHCRPVPLSPSLSLSLAALEAISEARWVICSVRQAWQANEIKTPLKLIHRSANKLTCATSLPLPVPNSLPPSLFPLCPSRFRVQRNRKCGKCKSFACPPLPIPSLTRRENLWAVSLVFVILTWHDPMLIWNE